MQNKKFDQISLEEFDSMNMDHTFSDNYNRKKQNLLHAVSESEHNRHRNHLYRVVRCIVALPSFPQPHMQLTDCFKCITTVPEHTAVIFL